MDPEGLRILDHVVALTGGRLWRVRITDYELAASGPAAPVALPSSPAHSELTAVAAAIRAHDRYVREEQVLGPLLADLRAWPLQDS